MKRLYLLRHAKAVRDFTIAKDEARPLAARGCEDAARLAAYLRAAGLRPDRVLCSPALRTRESWDIVVTAWDDPPAAAMVPDLYLAACETILELVRDAGDASGLMIVGHNPGLELCANDLARSPRSAEERLRLDGLRRKFPTCALAVLDFDIEDWCQIAQGEGALALFLRPKDLDPAG